ncbi:MAG TPA: PilZ domain-containing protein, partial [Planctomycetota bacterium]|nr:PilZ domain-containing protein [Planctomycetota bacterium]
FKKDFARQLLNVGLRGACIETTGRLRPDVKLNVEVRFDDLGGTLRSEARIVWSDTVQRGAEEMHRAGVRFVGTIEMTQPVRDYLQGKNVAAIVAQRRGEYADLKMQAQARKAPPPPKKSGRLKKVLLGVFVLLFLYSASYAGLVWRGRTDASRETVTYRYAGPDSAGGPTEDALAKIYSPLYWLAQKAGLPLVYARP